MDTSNKTTKKTAVIDAILILIIAILIFWNLKLAPQPAPKPANIVLSKFIDLYNQNVSSIEIWLENIGEQNAYNISAYVRCRDNNGTILFNKTLSLSAYFLRPNETCSTVYFVHFNRTATKLYYTIEVRWNDGMNGYYIEKVIEKR